VLIKPAITDNGGLMADVRHDAWVEKRCWDISPSTLHSLPLFLTSLQSSVDSLLIVGIASWTIKRLGGKQTSSIPIEQTMERYGEIDDHCNEHSLALASAHS
jgi:hypothetical protein